MKTIFKYGILAAFCGVTNIASARMFDNQETYDFDVDGVAYNILSEENRTVEVTHGTPINTSHSQFIDFQYEGDVVVPPTVKYKGVTYDVVAVDAKAFLPVGFWNKPKPESEITSITLPNSIKSIGAEAFRECILIKSLVIPEGVTEIEELTFYNCKALSDLQIKGPITKIGKSAFSHCENLTTLPNISHVTQIGDFAFEECPIESANIPNAVKEIGYKAFGKCKQLKEVTIPNSVEVLQGFSDCPMLGYVYISNSVKKIGEFNNCPNLKINRLPDSLDTIYSEAFSKSGITSVNIPAKVKFIGSKAFNRCKYLSSIEVDSRNKKYSSLDGVLFNKDRDTLILYPAGCRLRYDYTIPSSVKFVEGYAFDYNIGLTELRIPASIQKYGPAVFHALQNMCSIICESPQPIECTDIIKGLFTQPKIPYLFVPKGSVEAYKQADSWGRFFLTITDDLPDYIGVEDMAFDNSQNISVTGKDGSILIENAPANAVIRVYNLQGMPVAETTEPEIRNLSAGIYIITIETETVKVTVR